MAFAIFTYSLDTSPLGLSTDLRLVAVLIITQELHTIPKTDMNESSFAMRMSHMLSLSFQIACTWKKFQNIRIMLRSQMVSLARQAGSRQDIKGVGTNIRHPLHVLDIHCTAGISSARNASVRIGSSSEEFAVLQFLSTILGPKRCHQYCPPVLLQGSKLGEVRENHAQDKCLKQQSCSSRIGFEYQVAQFI